MLCMKKILIFEKMASIPSPYEKRWQAYLVPNKTDMASMFGPIFYQHGKHTWSLIFLTWQAYLVPKKLIWQAYLVHLVLNMASMSGPQHNFSSKHSQSTPIYSSVLTKGSISLFTVADSFAICKIIRLIE